MPNVNLIIRALARNLLSSHVKGKIDYYFGLIDQGAWGGPFNGQSRRRQLFESILSNVRPVAIVETGTYVGTTTELMAQAGVPVYTVEAQPRNYGYACSRLRRQRNIHMRFGDSRAGLRAFCEGALSAKRQEPIFVYLDAHWNDDLPLREELEIVFRNLPAAIVMIDDFQVPGDPGYGFDNYGPRAAVTQAHIAPVIAQYDIAVFYPSTPSSEEDGARRGCVVLAKKNTKQAEQLASCTLLRSAVGL